MSVRTIPAQHILVCDRCSHERSVETEATVPDDWMTLRVGHNGVRHFYVLCTYCVPAFEHLMDKTKVPQP